MLDLCIKTMKVLDVKMQSNVQLKALIWKHNLQLKPNISIRIEIYFLEVKLDKSFLVLG